MSTISAVNHLTSIQAVALGQKNVTVNAILPGVFPSKMTAFGIKQAGEQMAKSQPTGTSLPSHISYSLSPFAYSLLKQNHMNYTGRYGRPEDMAGIALFLVSPASAHVTGAHIVLDGGALVAGSGLTGNELPTKSKL